MQMSPAKRRGPDTPLYPARLETQHGAHRAPKSEDRRAPKVQGSFPSYSYGEESKEQQGGGGEENEATEEDGFVNEAPKGVGAIIKSAGRTTDNFLR